MARADSAQSYTQGNLDEVQDLQYGLEKERSEPFQCTSYKTICLTNNTESENNWLLCCATKKQMSYTLKMITKHKCSIGTAGFSLITPMKLDQHNPKNKALYNDILVSCKALQDYRNKLYVMVQASVHILAISTGIDLSHQYKDHSITKLSKLVLAVSVYIMGRPLAKLKKAREAKPYLSMFEDDWAICQILCQHTDSRRKYENAKVSWKVAVRVAFQRSIMLLESVNDSNMEDSRGDNSSGNEAENEDEWIVGLMV